MVFPAINQWLEADVVDTRDKCFVIYISIIIFVNNVCSKFDNISNFVFFVKHAKLGVQRSVFPFSNVKK